MARLTLAGDFDPAKPPARGEPELAALRKRAKQLARERRETPSTVHLLAAVCEAKGPARALLSQQRLDEARVLSAARTVTEDEDGTDAMSAAMALAHELAHRAALPAAPAQPAVPGAIHVLVALLSNRRFASHRALKQCGVDIARLRAAAMRVSLGVFTPPAEGSLRAADDRVAAAPVPALNPRARRAGKAIEVAWIPPAPRSSARPSASVPVERDTPPAAETAPADASEEIRGVASLAVPVPDALENDDESEMALGPLLGRIGCNWTAAALRGEIDPIVGRDQEVERALDVLAKRHANNPILVGPPGVGKTSVARGVAARLAAEGARRMMIEVPVGELIASTGSRGSLSERIADLRAEIAAADGNVVLFIDEICDLFGGAADEAIGELKAALAAGELPIIGATSPEQYRKVIEADAAIARRFTVVEVEPPSEDAAREVLAAVCRRLGAHHRARYTTEAIAQAASWAARYLPARALPDSAVAVLDLAGARARRRLACKASRRQEAEIGVAQVAEVVAPLCGVPVERLLESDVERMRRLEELLAERVVGHGEACARIAAVLRRNAAGLRGKRPIGTFLLLGPTGVGKTETAKAVAEMLFHSPEAMTRLDMSEYAEAHAVARLVGAPPGYVGHEAGGHLTDAVRKRPYQVLLLDEIEKAHRDVLESFLQVFDEGRLTDGRGRTADFSNAVIVLTSNLGAEELRAARSERRVGFATSARQPGGEQLAEVAVRAAKAALPPELYNRIDEVLFFAPLGPEQIAAIAGHLLAQLGAALAGRGIALRYEQAVIEALMSHGGYDPEFGARPMKRAIARLIEAPLADRILAGELGAGSIAALRVVDGEIAIDAERQAPRQGTRLNAARR